jgi:hypothetical protein
MCGMPPGLMFCVRRLKTATFRNATKFREAFLGNAASDIWGRVARCAWAVGYVRSNHQLPHYSQCRPIAWLSVRNDGMFRKTNS